MMQTLLTFSPLSLGTVATLGDTRKLIQGDARSLATILGSYIPVEAKLSRSNSTKFRQLPLRRRIANFRKHRQWPRGRGSDWRMGRLRLPTRIHHQHISLLANGQARCGHTDVSCYIGEVQPGGVLPRFCCGH